MRSTKIIKTLLTLIFALSLNSLSAQDKTTNSLIGTWELLKPTKVGDKTEFAPQRMLKIFNSDSSYCNLMASDKGCFITHKGIFKMIDNTSYIEEIKEASSIMLSNLASKTYKINYQIIDKEETTFLILKGTIENKDGTSGPYTEIWHRLTVPNAKRVN